MTNARLAEVAARAGLTPLDLLEAYRHVPADTLRTPHEGWFDPYHPNAKGHRLAAEFLAARVKAFAPGPAAPDGAPAAAAKSVQ